MNDELSKLDYGTELKFEDYQLGDQGIKLNGMWSQYFEAILNESITKESFEKVF